MKLAFIVYYMTYGGIERQITMLANYMAKKGHDVSVLSFVGNKSCYKIDSKINYRFYPDKGNGFAKRLNRYKFMRKALKEVKPDITITFMPQSAYFCSFMPNEITGKLLYSERGNPELRNHEFVQKIQEILSFQKIDYFIFQTQGAREFYSRSIIKRSSVIPNPVFITEKIENCTRRSRRIVNIGRLHLQKNQLLLINAFEKVHRVYPDYVLEIYGEGELENTLKEQIIKLKLKDYVFLMGTYRDIHLRINDAALFCLSSDYEGMPNALMEAMALGIPCISTDCDPGGAREIIHHGIDGLIVPKNNVNALADAMIKILSHPQKSMAMGMAAKINMKRFEKEQIYGQWERCFYEILK